MKVRMFNGFVEAEGSEAEMACYTMMLLEAMKHIKEYEDRVMAAKEASVIAELMRMPLEELFKREQDGDKE